MSRKANNSSGLPWSRIVVESTAIVLSILLAFAIDAWWDNHQDRKEEQQILYGLEDEFSAHVSDLERWNVRDDGLLAGMSIMMSYITGSEEQYSTAQLDSAMWAVAFAGTWDPTSSILDALLASGRLDLIQDERLRTKLAQWEAIVDEVRDNQLTMRDYLVNSLWPFLGSTGAPLARGFASMRTDLTRFNLESDARAEYSQIRGNRELYNMISIKYTWIWGSQEEIIDALQEAENIIDLIQNEISVTGVR